MSEKSGRGCFGKWLACGCGGCLLIIGACILFVVAIGGVAMFGISKSDPYQEALRRARSNPEVIAELGEPIEAGILTMGSISIDNASGNADIAIPIRGPQGEGTLFVVATKTAGTWSYSRMEVEFKPSGERVTLLESVLEQVRPTPLPESYD